MIITISGRGGSGKSTVGKLLAESLGYKYYSAGAVRRKYAESHGMTLAKLNELSLSDPSTDKLVDEYMAALGKKEDGFVVDGRLAYLMIPKSFKVFITVDYEIAAKRVMDDAATNSARNVEQFKSLSEAVAAMKAREKTDTERYLKLYGENPFLPKHYDLVVDSSYQDQYAVVELILRELEERGLLKERRSI